MSPGLGLITLYNRLHFNESYCNRNQILVVAFKIIIGFSTKKILVA